MTSQACTEHREGIPILVAAQTAPGASAHTQDPPERSVCRNMQVSFLNRSHELCPYSARSLLERGCNTHLDLIWVIDENNINL